MPWPGWSGPDVNPIERLLGWLWDPSGMRREAQMERLLRSARRRRAVKWAERRAITQIERTNRLVAQYGGRK